MFTIILIYLIFLLLIGGASYFLIKRINQMRLVNDNVSAYIQIYLVGIGIILLGTIILSLFFG